MNGWFPRLNRAGEIVSGAGEVWCRGEAIAVGTKPRWLDADTVAFLGPGDLLCTVGNDGSGPRYLTDAPPRNHVWGAGGGQVSFGGAPGEIAIEHDPVHSKRLVIVEHGGNDDRSIFYDGKPVIEHASVLEARCFDGLVTWRQWPHPTRVMGWRGGAVEELVTIPDTWCGNPVPIMMPEGPWFSFITNEDIRLCPWGDTHGYIIPTGADANLNHDAMGLGNKIRLVWNDEAGQLWLEDISLLAPRVDVRTPLAPPEPQSAPEPEPQPEPEETTVRMPDPVYDIFERLLTKFGTPLSDEPGREFMNKLAAQLAYSFPGGGYGQKRADPNRPISSDVLAQQHPTAGLIGWDLFVSLGAKDGNGNYIPPGIAPRGVESIDLAGQVLWPVAAFDYLGAAPPVPQPDPDPPPATDPDVEALLKDILAVLREIRDGQTAQTKAVGEGIAELKQAVKDFKLW